MLTSPSINFIALPSILRRAIVIDVVLNLPIPTL